ncbi:unnamed protein product [Protopolystoma xenopodis]|uniref:Uncharacterized protein n=1 Tax=Protopolystoma xenopodis TaxID=117903 RepID=A0A448WA78_9PLAT|nr:unnamed protein product [Protopolystoma xenopodis]
MVRPNALSAHFFTGIHIIPQLSHVSVPSISFQQADVRDSYRGRRRRMVGEIERERECNCVHHFRLRTIPGPLGRSMARAQSDCLISFSRHSQDGSPDLRLSVHRRLASDRSLRSASSVCPSLRAALCLDRSIGRFLPFPVRLAALEAMADRRISTVGQVDGKRNRSSRQSLHPSASRIATWLEAMKPHCLVAPERHVYLISRLCWQHRDLDCDCYCECECDFALLKKNPLCSHMAKARSVDTHFIHSTFYLEALPSPNRLGRLRESNAVVMARVSESSFSISLAPTCCNVAKWEYRNPILSKANL